MKDNFQQSLEMILKHEGLFSNHKDDTGGVTMRGVTQAVYEDWVDRPVTVDEMKALTVEDVAPIYKKNYWDKCKCDELPSGVDFCTFDMAINSGTGRGAKILQKVVGARQDGAIGPMTIAAVERVKSEVVINKYAEEREKFYRSLSVFSTFGRGWLRRTEETRVAALEMKET